MVCQPDPSSSCSSSQFILPSTGPVSLYIPCSSSSFSSGTACSCFKLALPTARTCLAAVEISPVGACSLAALEVVIAVPVVLRERLRRPVRLRGGGSRVVVDLRQASDACGSRRSDSEQDDRGAIDRHIGCYQCCEWRIGAETCGLEERKAFMFFLRELE